MRVPTQRFAVCEDRMSAGFATPYVDVTLDLNCLGFRPRKAKRYGRAGDQLRALGRGAPEMAGPPGHAAQNHPAKAAKGARKHSDKEEPEMGSNARTRDDRMTLPAYDRDPGHEATRADLLERAALLRSVGGKADPGMAVSMHNAGMPCDEIDLALGWRPGSARKVVVGTWEGMK